MGRTCARFADSGSVSAYIVVGEVSAYIVIAVVKGGKDTYIVV